MAKALSLFRQITVRKAIISLSKLPKQHLILFSERSRTQSLFWALLPSSVGKGIISLVKLQGQQPLAFPALPSLDPSVLELQQPLGKQSWAGGRSQLCPHCRSPLLLWCCSDTHPRPHNRPLRALTAKAQHGGAFPHMPSFSFLIILAQLICFHVSEPSSIQLQATASCFSRWHPAVGWWVVYCSPEQELVKRIDDLQCPFGVKQTSLVEFVKVCGAMLSCEGKCRNKQMSLNVQVSDLWKWSTRITVSGAQFSKKTSFFTSFCFPKPPFGLQCSRLVYITAHNVASLTSLSVNWDYIHRSQWWCHHTKLMSVWSKESLFFLPHSS